MAARCSTLSYYLEPLCCLISIAEMGAERDFLSRKGRGGCKRVYLIRRAGAPLL
jgi:hypothetical protein